ncbi:hypothetical protein BGZ97_004368 [Linnemannia gamsii]|uniref:WD40 repeat-like protein n=1 Tax=Linnemannia gamsii TaxID=64522 RepID=A0A9P6REW7_9FUNG|nr:hypothetical protein BGZ97_004368 [Linnemannia gamsii]
MELATACEDGSIRVWRLSSDDNDGNVVAKLIWGTNLRLLCAEGLIFKDVIDVSPIHQKLLVQCGALGEVLAQEKESNIPPRLQATA